MLPIVFLSRGVNFAAAAFASATAPRLRRIVFLAIVSSSTTWCFATSTILFSFGGSLERLKLARYLYEH
jgi:hypothetical protein